MDVARYGRPPPRSALSLDELVNDVRGELIASREASGNRHRDIDARADQADGKRGWEHKKHETTLDALEEALEARLSRRRPTAPVSSAGSSSDHAAEPVTSAGVSLGLQWERAKVGSSGRPRSGTEVTNAALSAALAVKTRPGTEATESSAKAPKARFTAVEWLSLFHPVRDGSFLCVEAQAVPLGNGRQEQRRVGSKAGGVRVELRRDHYIKGDDGVYYRPAGRPCHVCGRTPCIHEQEGGYDISFAHRHDKVLAAREDVYKSPWEMADGAWAELRWARELNEANRDAAMHELAERFNRHFPLDAKSGGMRTEVRAHIVRVAEAPAQYIAKEQMAACCPSVVAWGEVERPGWHAADADGNGRASTRSVRGRQPSLSPPRRQQQQQQPGQPLALQRSGQTSVVAQDEWQSQQSARKGVAAAREGDSARRAMQGYGDLEQRLLAPSKADPGQAAAAVAAAKRRLGIA